MESVNTDVRTDSVLRLTRAATIGIGGLIAAITPAITYAQQAADPAAQTAAAGDGSSATLRGNGTPESAGQIDDIVVTAQRRAENLQRVAISAQVVGQQALAQQNLTNIIALAEKNPSLHVEVGGRSSTYYIRGTGSGESQSFDQSVGTFIDDIYHGRSRNSTASFLDLDHVEILKGPQTTFFGNNAIAGAFNIVTKKPGDKIEGWARALISPTSGESGGQYVAEGAITLPLTDNLSVRVAGTVNGARGYQHNIVDDTHGPRERNSAFRATIRYAPSADFDVTLKGEIGRSIAKPGLIGRQANCPPPPQFGPPSGFCALAIAGNVPTSLRSSGFAASPGNQTRLHTKETVLTINHSIGDATLSSVTGYNEYRFGLDLDNDLSGLSLLNVQAPERYRQFSQELRLASPTGQTIEYLAGVYFQADQLHVRQSVNFFFLTPALTPVPPFAPLLPFLPLGQEITASQKERTYSGFASLTWNVNDQLKLVGGLRGSIVTKDFDWNLLYGTATKDYGGIVPLPANVAPIANFIGLGNAGSVSLKRKDKALMPSARIQYQVDRDVMTYASYARGFKAGGFSLADVTAIPANFPFSPEHVNAYEIGLKSEFFDRKVLVNLAAFRNDFTDLQVAVAGSTTAGAFVNFIRNAAGSRSQGVELEAQWVVSPIFRLSTEGTYLDSKYRTYRNAAPTLAQQLAFVQANPGQPPSNTPPQDLSGHRTLFAPKWSGNVTGTLTVPVFGSYRLTAEASAILSAKFQTYVSDDDETEQPGYARLDARISFDSSDGRWGLDVIGKNLTNRVVRILSAYEPTSFGSLIQTRQQLRSVAFQARYKF